MSGRLANSVMDTVEPQFSENQIMHTVIHFGYLKDRYPKEWACVNPDHLFLGTRKENMEDAVSKGRQAKGFDLPHTKLSDQDKEGIVYRSMAGERYSDIGNSLGISKQYAGKIAIKHGVRRNGFR